MAVCEYIDFSLTDDCLVHSILDSVLVDVVIAFLLVKSVVEHEFVVLDLPGYPVYLKVALVDDHIRVETREAVDFSRLRILLKEGSFPHCHRQF